MSYRIPRGWIQLSVITGKMVLPEILQTGKASPNLEYIEMQKVFKINYSFFPGWKQFNALKLPHQVAA